MFEFVSGTGSDRIVWLRRLSILPVMAALSCSVIAGLKDGKLAPDGGAATGGAGGTAGTGTGGAAGSGGSAGSGTGGAAGSGTGGTAGSGTGGSAGSGTGGGGTGGSGTGGSGTGGSGGSAGSGTGGSGGGNYPAAVLADGPVGYWRLGEKSGTTAKDSSGHGHDGVIKGTVSLNEKGALTGDADTAFYFDGGGSSYVDLGNNFGFVGKAPFSIEAWVYPQTTGRGFLGKANYTTNYVGYFLAEGGGALQFVRENAVCAWTSNTVSETAYSYVVGTFDGVNWTLYVNGKVVGTKAATNSISTIPDSFLIGTVTQWNTMVGWIDEVAVYDKALGAARITAHYNAGMGK